MDTKVISSGVLYTSLPASYVRPESERPRLSEVSTCENVPVIDLGCEDRSQIVRQIGDACEHYGFFQVINHGVSLEAVEKMLGVAHDFFSLPVEEKLKLYYFFTSFNVNWRNYLRLHCYPLDTYVPEWTSNPPPFSRNYIFPGIHFPGNHFPNSPVGRIGDKQNFGCHCGANLSRSDESFQGFIISCNAVFVLLVPFLIGFIQIKFQGTNQSPFQTRLPSMWASVLATFVYCFALAATMKFKCTKYGRFSGHVAFLAGSFLSISLVSFLLPARQGPLVFVAWAILHIMVARSTVQFICLWIYQRIIVQFICQWIWKSGLAAKISYLLTRQRDSTSFVATDSVSMA